MKYRVWWHDEFKDCEGDEDCLSDRAWEVPDRRGILYPENSAPCNDVRDAAEQFAEYFHSHRDGWECSWPLEFIVHDGAAYHLVNVEREVVPHFHAATPKEIQR